MARSALGRGLSALIREPESVQPIPSTPATGTQEVDIDLIDPSPFQPRTKFREEQLEELARSIRTSGVIQPLVLRRVGARFQLIAGERRWRAAQRAGLHKVPAVIRDVSDAAALELTLVENIQREDLNPIEQARAFSRLMSEFQLTQEAVADRTGKDRATVANAIRLLKLETPIQELIEDGKLTAGHGRTLLAISDPKTRMSLALRASRGELTVRQLERLAARIAKPEKSAQVPEIDPNVRAALEALQQALGTKVRLNPVTKRRPGELIIEYYNDSQLEGIYQKLVR